MSKKIALVLSGGGARGLAHIGVIEELEKRGYQINSIAGTSMGALVGGVYALGKMEAFKNWMISLDKRKVFSLVDFTLSSNGLVKGDRVLNAMKEFIPDTNIEDLEIDYSATAADITNHKEIVYRSGSLYDAIRASIAIPTVLTPVIKGDAIIVDGGVINNIPIKNVKRTEGDLLVAVYVNADTPVKKPPVSSQEEKKTESIYQKWLAEFYENLHKILPTSKKEKMGYFSLLDETLTSASLQLAKLTIEKGAPDVLINVSRDACGTYDFYMAKELIEIGRYAAITTLDEMNL
ncbi:patatin-like phospholipase family protein [Draconibacterium sp.]|nr:patatin-like phospholipase family protein [Draconibacterium sp.]